MIGLALEGGGSRGAYHMGVVKAYVENGYEFDGFVGTSIGAVNAAMLAQGDFEKALELWSELSMDQIFDADESRLIKIGESKWDMRILNNVKNSIGKIIESGGIDTSKIKAVFDEHIDEQKLRSSSRDYGLVTVSISERKARELFIEDIPQGHLLKYIMASACFPGFKSEVIDGSAYIDGGLYNNCPVNMLLQKGYDEIVVVRTGAPGIFRKFKTPRGVQVTTISPGEDLGNVMLFSPERTEKSIQMGYFDGLRALRGLKGRSYYLSPAAPDEALRRLMSLSDRTVLETGKLLGINGVPVKRMLFEQIIPKLGAHLKLEKDFDYDDFVIALMESAASSAGIERYEIYDCQTFASMIGESDAGAAENAVSLKEKLLPVKYDSAAQRFLRGFLNRE